MIFSLLAAILVTRILVDLFITQRFMLAWRAWLTDRLTGDWLDGRAYYRTRFIDDTIDNPDQRIQSDIDVFTAISGPTTEHAASDQQRHTAFRRDLRDHLGVSFTSILWNLSGELSLFGFELPRAMFWLGVRLRRLRDRDRVLARPSADPAVFNNEKFNAAFRYALVRLRDAAEAVALYRGEKPERLQLRERFEPVVSNYKRFVNRTMVFTGWNLSMNHIIIPLPWLLQAPRLFAGQIQLGTVIQSVAAFGAIQDALSFFRNSYDTFAGYRASILRLHGLVTADEQSRALPELAVAPTHDGAVELDAVEVRSPAGEQLISDLHLRLTPGESLIITGKSGTGKSTLLRSLAELWPYTSGTMHCPGGEHETMFLSQLPYVPLGDLRTVVSYPHEPGEIPDDVLRDGAGGRRAAALHRPARRRGRLGQGALPRRAAAHRVRPGAADQTQGGVPRRGDLGPRRAAGVHDLQPGAPRTARRPCSSASPTAAPSTGITTSISSYSAKDGGSSVHSPLRAAEP